MCDVCKIEEIDTIFVNGPDKPRSVRVKLYKVYKGDIAIAALCHLHSIELFLVGEPSFYKAHKRFALNIAKKTREAEDDYDFDETD